jgi:hypothetical protein
MCVEKGGKIGPGRQVRRHSSEACNYPTARDENGFTVWSQLTQALLTHFDIMMDRFKNAFLMTGSVCPTGGRPPAARNYVLARSTTPDYLSLLRASTRGDIAQKVFA